MSYYIVDDICIGCGACEHVCPSEAIGQLEGGAYRVTYVIDPVRCNDCAVCPTACPVDCIHQDPDSIICHGRGCPLNQRSALREWECTQLAADGCPRCGNVLWRPPGGEAWLCFRCDEGHGPCPKVRAGERPGYTVTPRES